MSLLIAQWLVGLGLGYAAIGLLFAIPFAVWGAPKVDPSAQEGTWGFRLLILPGSAALWPLLAWRWLRGVDTPPAERNPHRCAAHRGTDAGAGQ